MTYDSSKILAEHFAKALEETKRIAQNLQQDVHNVNLSQASIKAELEAVNKELNKLSSIIRDDNGERSVMARLLILENKEKNTEKFIEEFKKEKNSLAIEETKGKWQLRIAMFSGFMGLLTAAASILINLF